MKRNDLLKRITAQRDIIRFSFYQMYVITKSDGLPLIKEYLAQFEFGGKHSEKLLTEKDFYKHVFSETHKLILKSCLVDICESIKGYQKLNGQASFLEKSQLFTFLKIIRNCFEHNYEFRFNDKTKKNSR